ncbi:MAG: restriction endonuclease [Ardenticatenaceae bacterium]|nr:restriction endonuclease [Ardenticatenaceae bacterium]
MLARFHWLQQFNQPVVQLRRASAQAAFAGRRLLAGLTAVFGLWVTYRAMWQPAWIARLPGTFTELLSLSEVAGAVTLVCLWIVVAWQYRRRDVVTIPAVDVDTLYALSPYDFEIFVAQLFRKKGYRVTHRGRSGDMGVDLEIAQASGRRAIVQCKRYRSTIGPEIVRELYGTLIHEEAVHAFLVTTADISESAREWAQGKPITLIDGTALGQITAVLSETTGK